MPTLENDFNYQRIEQAIRYLEENFLDQPNLDEVAAAVAMSPFHFQRLFTQWAGISPKRFLQYLTTDFLKNKLADCTNLLEAAETAGLSSQSRVYDLFVTLEAVTPQEYKTHGKGMLIEYGIHATPFGTCLIGITERGICQLTFFDNSPDEALQALRNDWSSATLIPNQVSTAEYMDKIFLPHFPQAQKLHLLVKGTNFQVKVWEALLRIPAGSLATYQAIARQVNNPKALQAVGSAVGANPVAYLIPCHRVIRKDGLLGEYRWGATRKKAIVGWEMAQHDLVPLT